MGGVDTGRYAERSSVPAYQPFGGTIGLSLAIVMNWTTPLKK
jgi:hypothetical protein